MVEIVAKKSKCMAEIGWKSLDLKVHLKAEQWFWNLKYKIVSQTNSQLFLIFILLVFPNPDKSLGNKIRVSKFSELFQFQYDKTG